jgi:hypothetical protein
VSALRELQLAVSAAILDGAPADSAGVVANGLAPERRLRIYRNNTRENLLQALRAVYPVVERVVGAEFFLTAANRYVATHGSRCGDLNRYGATFPSFLAGYKHARGLPYLKDLARLEWALREAFYAADAPVLEPGELAGVQPEQVERLCLRLHPSVRLLASPYPLLAIWSLESDQDRQIDLGAGLSRLLLLRPALEVQVVEVAAEEFAMLATLKRGVTLQGAFAAGLRLNPGFDLGAALLRLLTLNSFTDFTVAGGAGANRQSLPSNRRIS